MDFKISAVTPEELPVLLDLVRELACFERLEHEVQATVEDYSQSFFGPQPVAGGLLARSENQIAGYAMYFFTFSSFVGRAGIWLEDLYVRPEFRKQGLGRALIEAVARVGAQQNCGRYEWTALNWNKGALDFYKKLGARTLDDWVMLRLDEKGLRRLSSSGTRTK